jgi:8-amino-7-oxononanoate synthase
VPEKTPSLPDRLRQALSTLQKNAQLRVLEQLQGVNLCSNDYLGLSTDTRLKQALREAVAHTTAVGSTGSRLLSGNGLEWEELEVDFAKFAGTEAALYFSSGYSANVGLLSALLKPSDIVFSDRLNHASIIDGIRLAGARKVVYPHCDVNFLKAALEQYRDQPGARVIVTESVFSMDGDVAPLLALRDLARQNAAELVVDEAHATGVIGPRGRGVNARLGIEKDMLAIVHTCGKALASMGAFVCSGLTLKQYLVNHARTFIFSTAVPPYLAHQIRAAMYLADAADSRRDHLFAIAGRVREQLRAAGLEVGSSNSHIVPVILGSNEIALHVARRLQSNGFAVRAIRPPTVPPGTSRLRLSLTSEITNDQVSRLCELIVESVEGVRQSGALVTHG